MITYIKEVAAAPYCACKRCSIKLEANFSNVIGSCDRERKNNNAKNRVHESQFTSEIIRIFDRISAVDFQEKPTSLFKLSLNESLTYFYILQPQFAVDNCQAYKCALLPRMVSVNVNETRSTPKTPAESK